MDMAKETAKERGGGPANFTTVLSVSGAGGITLWFGDIFFSAAMSRKLEGVHMGFL